MMNEGKEKEVQEIVHAPLLPEVTTLNKLTYAGVGLFGIGGVLDAVGMGGIGLGFGGIAAIIAWHYSPEIRRKVGDMHVPLIGKVDWKAAFLSESRSLEQEAVVEGSLVQESAPTVVEAVLPVEPTQTPQATNERRTADASGRFPEPQDMAEIIEQGFKPSRESILLMNTINGYATEKVSKLHHIGLGGSSGRGKTNTTRLITSQLLACGAKVYMVNPNFAPIKHNGNRLEDWRPIAAKLQQPVARNAPEIESLLNYFMRIFEERREREQLTPKRGADLFLVLGEWPVIVEEYPNAVKIISRLLRQSRQYGIHIIAEFQDALISTIGGSGGTRANYGTAFFFGGDVTTAKTLLSLPDGTKIDNTGLGDKGAVYLKSFSSQAVPGRVPFFSNKALYMLLGCIGESVTDELVDEDEFYEDEEDDFEDEEEENEPALDALVAFLGKLDKKDLLNLIERLPDHSSDEEELLTEREQQYEQVLGCWSKNIRSIRPMMPELGLNFNQTRELMEEMDDQGLIPWRKNGSM
jgi:hypothetical protein